jgi:hypothetical protein
MPEVLLVVFCYEVLQCTKKAVYSPQARLQYAWASVEGACKPLSRAVVSKPTVQNPQNLLFSWRLAGSHPYRLRACYLFTLQTLGP